MGERLTERLRQSEYTGENRCKACTVVNIIIAGIIGTIIGRKSKFAGAISIGISILLIYFRGYIIPGTPTWTKRSMPTPILRLFGKEPEIRRGLTASSGSDTNKTDPTTFQASNKDIPDKTRTESEEKGKRSIEEHFISAGIVAECEEKDDLCITGSFESEWSEEIDKLNDGNYAPTDVAAALDLNLENYEFTIRENDQARQLKRDQQIIGQWPSEAALIADVAASQVLESWDNNWSEYESAEKGEFLNGLRLFLDTCPTSDGDVVLSEETVESCCSTHEVVAAVCEETDERIFEHQI